MTSLLTFDLETAIKEGAPTLVGTDEVGRGALAGPVVAAAVVLPLHDSATMALLEGVKDSKLISAKKRAHYSRLIRERALVYGVGGASAELIDRYGIVPATHMAMRQALGYCLVSAEKRGLTLNHLLVDGRSRLPNSPLPQTAIIKGDTHSLSIAAASIVAKVARDGLLTALGTLHAVYRFEQHKGYATAQHLAALEKHGPTGWHRHSFAPIRRDDA